MNRIVVAIACVLTSGACGLALAQTTPPEQQPPSPTAPPSGEQPTAPADSGNTTTSADQREQIRECVSKQQRSNSGMSNKDATTYCINQVKNAPPK